MGKIALITIVSSLGLLALSTATAKQDPLKIPKVDAQIEVDGELNEAFWQQATQVNLGVETRPGENVEAKVKTTAYIAENGTSLLIALVADDPDPSQILASLKDRDTIWADDSAGFKVDTFNDERKAYIFFVNPLGIQMDSIEDDVTGNLDSSWDAIWYSEGKITDTGYQVEIEIPFKVLRFPNTSGEKTWGIDFVRFYPRDYQYRLAFNQVARDQSCSVCQISKISGFESIESGQNLEVTPYISAQRIDDRNPPSQSEWQNGDFDFDGGLDVRWGVTDNSVLNATINPDFSQVESDAVQLDVNRTFALFFEEKRPFFLEGADYFNTSFLNLLHTRNIADPDFGLKYTGKSGKHSYGVLAARDNSTSFLQPAAQSSGLATFDDLESDAFAARYSYDMGDKSQIGAMLTYRSGDDYENTMVSLDGKYYFTDEDVLRYQAVYSDSEDPESLRNETDYQDYNSGSGYALAYNHNGRNWNWRASRVDFEEGFRADLGFINQVGFSRDLVGLGYTWQGEEGDTFDRIALGGDVDRTEDFTGQKLEEEAEFWLNVNGPYQSWFGFGAGVRDVWRQDERIPLAVDMPRICVAGCWFDQDFYWIEGNFRPITSLQIGSYYNGGDALDFEETRAATRKNYGLWFNWQATRHWYLSTNLRKSQLDIDEGSLFDANILNLNSTYQFDKKQYIRLTVRYRDIDFNPSLYEEPKDSNRKSMARQLLYAYKVNPRTVFFLGYSDGGFEDDSVDDFEKTSRSVFSKFSYAFQL
ncbi:carbohydrate binding family 9 domain-containing protein [Kangiella sp. TOML190]|uniref:carbohydrate binding family 9 domain-containing protein n=1 Tax=Kangiella sp. TOML190 TaxID=2931351 RepID=UPI00203A7465|nr:DUF5916 domain-containing protein [Kangiella sp. TOML190]